MMKKLIQTVADAVSQLMRFLLRVSDRRAERREEKKKEKVLDLVEEARKSVVEGDEDTLNQIIEDRRMADLQNKQGFARTSILACMMILCSFFLMSGCITSRKTVVIPSDRKVSRIELDGVSGWFVPDATMADLIESYVVMTHKVAEGRKYEDTME